MLIMGCRHRVAIAQFDDVLAPANLVIYLDFVILYIASKSHKFITTQINNFKVKYKNSVKSWDL